MQLYKIANEHKNLITQLDGMDIDEKTISDTLESLGVEEDFESKAISVSAYALNLKAEQEKVKEAAKRMADRAKGLEKKYQWLNNYLLKNMQTVNKEEIKNEEFHIKISKNPPSVHIYDEEALSLDYFNTKIVHTVDKARIAEKLKAGEEVEGATLKQTERLTIK